jgi:26S proteasome regulatory subunit N8
MTIVPKPHISFLLVPFDEDDLSPSIWFLDHNFHENMFAMFKKVNGE